MRRASSLYNLSVTHPDVSREWNYAKNIDLRPEHFTHGSDQKVWWKCSKGHEWQTLIRSRTESIRGCPACWGRVATSEINLAVLYPELVGEWHPERNADLKPEDFRPKSSRRIWWRCPEGHEWQATIGYRTGNGLLCPYCSRKVASPQYNLATEYPEIAKQWHYERNNGLIPENFLPGVDRKVWWICLHGHEWQAKIYSRCKDARSCPGCSGHKATKENNLAKNLELIREWHPDRNGELRPETLMPKSGIKVWWKCPSGHEWRTSIVHRSNGKGCPFCAKGGFSLVKSGYFYLQEIKKQECAVLKFGITNRNPAVRMAQQRQSSAAEHRLIQEPIFFAKGCDAARLERAIKEKFKEKLMPPFPLKFDGYTETLPMESLDEVLEFMMLTMPSL